jgi:hypothetical protein
MRQPKRVAEFMTRTTHETGHGKPVFNSAIVEIPLANEAIQVLARHHRHAVCARAKTSRRVTRMNNVNV